MSNEPTKDTDRWNIGKSNIVQNVAFLLLCLTVITGLILWFAWPVIETTGRLIQFLRVAYTSEWTEGGF